MSGETDFRTPEQEILKLLDECSEIRRTLQSMSAQVGRMETRVKRAFPAVADKAQEKARGANQSKTSSLSSEQALAEFDRIVELAKAEAAEAERALYAKSAADLFAIAKEIGVSFSKSKPSVKAIREGVFGKIRESMLLAQHNPRVRE